MTDFQVFLVRLPFAFMGLMLATILLALLTANPDVQMQLADVIGD